MTRLRMPRFTALPAEVSTALDALRAKFEVPQDFSAAALAEAQEAADGWSAQGAARLLEEGGRDARHLELVTIDPPGSMDLDQALLIERPRQGPAYRVSYAIASLGSFVRPGGALDADLHARGETVYAPDHATALHPECLSHAAASLLPGQDCPAYLWTIDLDEDGQVLSAHVERALVRSRARLSYAQVQDALDAKAALPPGVRADMPGLLEAVGRARIAREVERGGISLRTPEQEIEELGAPDGQRPKGYRLVFRASLPVEEYNAQISLLTGMCAAQIMLEAGVGVLRTMPPAPQESLGRLRRVARALRISWPKDLSYPDLVRTLSAQQPNQAAFMNQAVSLFRGVGYTSFGVEGLPVPQGDQRLHAAVAAPYAHVTAPLRRLVDRYGAEVCLAVCAQEPVPQWVLDALPGLPETMATTGRRANGVERGALNALEALVLAGSVGEVFEGVITSVRGPKGEVVLSEPAVVGTVVTEDSQRLPLGDAVRVRLTAADPSRGYSSFALV